MDILELIPGYSSRQAGRIALGVMLVLLSAGCASPPPDPEPVPVPEAAMPSGTSSEPPAVQDVPPQVQADFDRGMEYIKAGDHEKGIALLYKVTEEVRNYPAPFVNLGIAYARTGKTREAEASFAKALELDPDHPVAGNESALLLRKAGKFGEARQLYEKMLRKHPRFYMARRNLGILCDLYIRDAECALKQYEAYSKAFPDNQEVKKWIADIRLRTGPQE